MLIHDSFKQLFIELKTEHTIQRWCTTSDAEEADVPNGCVDSEDGTEVSVTLSKVRFDILNRPDVGRCVWRINVTLVSVGQKRRLFW